MSDERVPGAERPWRAGDVVEFMDEKTGRKFRETCDDLLANILQVAGDDAFARGVAPTYNDLAFYPAVLVDDPMFQHIVDALTELGPLTYERLEHEVEQRQRRGSFFVSVAASIPESERERTILLLLTTAADLLAEATKLNGDENESWHVGHVTKRDRPPFVFPEE